jgi:hypothetical protein
MPDFSHRIDCSTEVRAVYVKMKYDKIIALKHHIANLNITYDGIYVYIDGWVADEPGPKYIRGMLDGIKETITVYYEG